jgi:hypothetical protein
VALLDTLSNVLGGAAEVLTDPTSAVRRVTVESNVAPAIVLDRPLGDGGAPSGPGELLGRLLRPRIRLELAGGNVVTAEPYGPPNPAAWKWVAVGAAAISALAIVGVLALRRAK